MRGMVPPGLDGAAAKATWGMMFNFRKLLQKGAEHPLGDLREAKKLIDDLPLDDPLKGLHEISFWLDSMRDVEGIGLDERLSLFKLLDETAQPLRQELVRRYVATARMDKARENRLWLRIFEFCRQAAEAYLYCIDAARAEPGNADAIREDLPLVTVRALRALAEQDKWLGMRYRPKDERIWERMAKLYLFAEAHLFTLGVVVPYGGQGGYSNVLLEFARALLLNVSAPDKLLPAQIELADRLATYCAGALALSERPETDSMFYIDLAAKRPPARLLKGMPITPTMRFFAAAAAARKLEGLSARAEAGELAPHIDLDGFASRDISEVIGHLGQYWASSPSQRKHARKRIVARLDVIHGLRQIQQTMVAESRGTVDQDEKDILYRQRVDMKIYGFVTARTRMLMADAAAQEAQAEEHGEIESWVMENMSECGYGAVIPQLAEDWVRIGTLLALRPEDGSHWSVGLVRRLGRDREHRVYVGIQQLAQNPVPARLWPLAREISMPQSLTDAPAQDHVCAMLLRPSAGCGEMDSLLVASGNFVAGRVFEMLIQGDKRLIRLERLLEAGQDFQRVSFSDVSPSPPA